MQPAADTFGEAGLFGLGQASLETLHKECLLDLASRLELEIKARASDSGSLEKFVALLIFALRDALKAERSSDERKAYLRAVMVEGLFQAYPPMAVLQAMFYGIGMSQLPQEEKHHFIMALAGACFDALLSRYIYEHDIVAGHIALEAVDAYRDIIRQYVEGVDPESGTKPEAH